MIPPKFPKVGAANTTKGKAPPFCRLFFLPPMYQTPRLTDFFLIPRTHRPSTNMLYAAMLIRINICTVHSLIYAVNFFWWRHFLEQCTQLFLNRFVPIFPFNLYTLYLLWDLDIFFRRLRF